MLSRNFLLANAEISLNEFSRLTSRAKRKYVVVTRAVEGRVYHYVFLRKALEEALKRFRINPRLSIETALNLHEYYSDPSIEIPEEPRSGIATLPDLRIGPNISVVTSEGSVVGVFDPMANRSDATYEVKGLNFVYRLVPPAASSERGRQATYDHFLGIAQDGALGSQAPAKRGKTKGRAPRPPLGRTTRARPRIKRKTPNPTERGPSHVHVARSTRRRHGREAPRYVNVCFVPIRNRVPIRREISLRAGRDYRLRIDIGGLSADSVVRNPKILPVDRLPPSESGHWLEVAVLSDDFVVRPRLHSLFLPRVGSGWVCDCTPGGDHSCTPGVRSPYLLIDVRAPEVPGIAHLRIAVYYRNNLVQSQILSAEILATESQGAGQRSSIDYTLTAHLRDVELLPPRSLNILTNQNSDGTHTIVFKNGVEEALAFTLRDIQIRSAINDARGTLLGVLGEKSDGFDENNSKAKAYFVEDLKKLSQVGWNLWNSLWAQGPPEQKTRLKDFKTVSDKTIQVSRVQGASFVFPWALVYDIPLSTNSGENKLCQLLETWEQRLNTTDDLPTACPYAETHSTNVICPYGFWGLRHIIEQPPSSYNNELPISIRVNKRPEIVTSISLELDRDLTGRHLQTISNLLRGFAVATADSRKDVGATFSRQNLEIVYFYCHGKRELRPGGAAPIPYLEIGDKEQIKPADITTWYFAESTAAHHWETTPLVFINGCHTAELSPELLVNFVDVFSSAKAGGVIGTEISVDQPIASEAAERFLFHFGNQQPVGEALRRVRLGFLKKGNLMGLAYTAYCSSDLHISNP